MGKFEVTNNLQRLYTFFAYFWTASTLGICEEEIRRNIDKTEKVREREPEETKH